MSTLRLPPSPVTMAPTLLSIAPELRVRILGYCFTGLETYYDHEGKRHIYESECDYNTFSICKVNKQLHEEAVVVMKSKTAILDCSHYLNPRKKGERVRDISFFKNLNFKNIRIVLISPRSARRPDFALLANLEVVAVATLMCRTFGQRAVGKSKPDVDSIIRKVNRRYLRDPFKRYGWLEDLIEGQDRKFSVWVKYSWFGCPFATSEGDGYDGHKYEVSLTSSSAFRY